MKVKQKNGHDCGLHALGYIASSICGLTPGDGDIDVDALRKNFGNHILDAFDKLSSKEFTRPIIDTDPSTRDDVTQ